jgi:hypothetical protein
MESRRDPPLRPPESFTWRVEVEGGRQYLALSWLPRESARLRLWVNPEGRKMLWGMAPNAPDPPTATLLVRDGTAPVGRRAKRRRPRRCT